MDKIKQLKEEIARLEKEEKLAKERESIPFMELAKIGQSLNVPEEARIKYEELFTDFALRKIDLLKEQYATQKEQYATKKKKFIIKIGWE